jgi:hypothetical protein
MRLIAFTVVPDMAMTGQQARFPAGEERCLRKFDFICRTRRNRQMIRKLKSGQYRLYSRKKDLRTGKRKNLGTFDSRAAAEKHERAVQYFKHGGR